MEDRAKNEDDMVRGRADESEDMTNETDEFEETDDLDEDEDEGEGTF